MSWFYVSIATQERFVGSVFIEAEKRDPQKLAIEALTIAGSAIKMGEEGSTLIRKMAQHFVPSPEYVGRLLTKHEIEQAVSDGE